MIPPGKVDAAANRIQGTVDRPRSWGSLVLTTVALASVLAASGCGQASKSQEQADDRSEVEVSTERLARNVNNAASVLQSEAPSAWPDRITNRFGMTFQLVRVDASRSDHEASYPEQAYYLQTTEVTWEQHMAFRKAALGDDTCKSIDWDFNSGTPSQWADVITYARALSLFDDEFDYTLPSQAEWRFACRNGYRQHCDRATLNQFGFQDMLDGDVEVSRDTQVLRGHEYGVGMGHWKSNWGEHRGESEPDCPCEYWTLCNPAADDSLDELIVTRLLLLPAATAPTPRTTTP